MFDHDLSRPFKALALEMTAARAKFPGNDRLFEALVEEVGEVGRAVLTNNFEHARQEALQVACVAMRLATEGDRSWETSRPEDRFTVQEMADAFWDELHGDPEILSKDGFVAWVESLLQQQAEAQHG